MSVMKEVNRIMSDYDLIKISVAQNHNFNM